MYRLLLLFLCSLLTINSLCQETEEIVSIRKKIKTTNEQKLLFTLHVELFDVYRRINPDSGEAILNRATKFAKTNDEKAMVMIQTGKLLRVIDEHKAGIIKCKQGLKATSSNNHEQRNHALMNLGYAYELIGNLDSSLYFYRIGFKESLKTSSDSLKIDGASSIANLFYFTGMADSALFYFDFAVDLAKKAGKKEAYADVLMNRANVYNDQGMLDKAKESYLFARKTYTELGITWKEIYCLSNLAQQEISEKRYHIARQYLDDAMRLSKEINDSNQIIKNHSMYGYIYAEEGNNKEAIRIFNECRSYYEKNDDARNVARIANSMGVVYSTMGDSKNAILNFEKSIAIKREMNEVLGLINALINVGESYRKEGRLQDAIKALNEAYERSVPHYNRIAIMAIPALANSLYDAGNYKLAYERIREYMLIRDTVYNEDSEKLSAELNMQFQTEKKDIENARLKEQNERMSAENELKDARQKEVYARQNAQRNILVGAGVSLLIIVLIISKSLRKSRKDNKIIREQKKEVDFQKNIAEEQRHLAEERNKEITDSITYAKRLQDAILPSETMFLNAFGNNYFVLYKPKDIVAGDFYWMQKIGSTVFIAAADCTGHGVPGAMVSMVCSNALTRAVKESGITEVNQILDKTRDLVIESFSATGSNVKDGMDISLAAINFNMENGVGASHGISLQNVSNYKLWWAGANNPLWIVRSKAEDSGSQPTQAASPGSATESPTWGHELIELKPDKQPIGQYADAKPFTKMEMTVSAGDVIYLITDGFQDQFGGEKGKKFKAANLKSLLLSIHNETMEQQKFLLNESLNNWRGKLEQVDDICIIGIRI